jgi:hypothetical protein
LLERVEGDQPEPGERLRIDPQCSRGAKCNTTSNTSRMRKMPLG